MDHYLLSQRSPFSARSVSARIQRNNRAVHMIAAELGLEVFPLADLVSNMGIEEVLVDGLHMHHEAHVRVGEELADFLTRPCA